MSLPPPQPAYIFRGHAAQIHTTLFIRANTRLVTGDAEGWIVVWSLASRRPTAVWRAHEAAILTVAEWGPTRLITHGKDNKLIVWKFSDDDELSLSTALPVEDPTTSRKQPWLLHLLHVNTLNFCSFAHCAPQTLPDATSAELSVLGDEEQLLIALPNTMSSEAVDIFHLPSQKRLGTVHGDRSTNTGMVMALRILYLSSRLTIVVGYESGHTMVTQQIPELGWCILYFSQPHSQPILSLDVVPGNAFYFTSGADAVLAKHPLSSLSPVYAVPESSQQSSISQAPRQKSAITTSGEPISLLSAQFAQAASSSSPSSSTPVKPPLPAEIQSKPLKIIQTKHAGQQSLTIRSDARILATAGWDARVRIYGVNTMKELAVLKWHKEGCYAVSFAEVLDVAAQQSTAVGSVKTAETREMSNEEREEQGNAVFKRPRALGMTTSVKEKRILRATRTHWVAAGSKDGKVSLWEIY